MGRPKRISGRAGSQAGLRSGGRENSAKLCFWVLGILKFRGFYTNLNSFNYF